MGYDYTCDDGRSEDCFGSVTDELPALMSDFNDTWFKATREGDILEESGYHYADTVTICPPCLLATLLDE